MKSNLLYHFFRKKQLSFHYVSRFFQSSCKLLWGYFAEKGYNDVGNGRCCTAYPAVTNGSSCRQNLAWELLIFLEDFFDGMLKNKIEKAISDLNKADKYFMIIVE